MTVGTTISGWRVISLSILVLLFVTVIACSSDAELTATPEPIATTVPPTATPEPTVPAGPTPIAALTVPGGLALFQDLESLPLGFLLHGNNLEMNTVGGSIDRGNVNATPTAG